MLRSVCDIRLLVTLIVSAFILQGSVGAQPQGTEKLSNTSFRDGVLARDLSSERASGNLAIGTVSRSLGINSADRDNNPVVSADGNIIFFNSTREGNRSWGRYNPLKERYDDDIYFAMRSPVRGGQDAWEEPINIGPAINSSQDDGVVAISPDGQTLFFNSLKQGWEGDGGPFYHTTLHGRDWSDVTGLGGGITQFFKDRPKGAGFRIYGGSISSDGKDFYFASTLFSPTGKHQIWVSHRENGEWSYPVNLGPAINHGGGSYAPCIAADGKTLFYAACGRTDSYGGDDIYTASNQNGVWGEPVNVGAPINTVGDDSFLSLPASGDRAYFSITVDGNEDIYTAPLPHLLRPSGVVLLSGAVTDKATGKPLEATVVIEDLASGTTIFTSTSNASNGLYTTVLHQGHDYGISISAPGYLFRSDRYTIPADGSYEEMHHPVELMKMEQGESFVVNNIFFDYNTAVLSPASRPELDRIIGLMNEHTEMLVRVSGHTDNVGSDEYNRKLSLQRAEAVREYLVNSGGIQADRIVVTGAGASQPLASNASEAGRNQNRRSEFTIVRM